MVREEVSHCIALILNNVLVDSMCGDSVGVSLFLMFPPLTSLHTAIRMSTLTCSSISRVGVQSRSKVFANCIRPAQSSSCVLPRPASFYLGLPGAASTCRFRVKELQADYGLWHFGRPPPRACARDISLQRRPECCRIIGV